MSFATGILAFDEVCKRFETMAIRQEDELKSAYTRLQVGWILSPRRLSVAAPRIAGEYEEASWTT